MTKGRRRVKSKENRMARAFSAQTEERFRDSQKMRWRRTVCVLCRQGSDKCNAVARSRGKWMRP